jgi:Contractile injection system tube protein
MSGGLEKAFIALKDGSGQLECAFNPREYTISKSGTWHKTPAKGAKKAPKPEFVGANPASMSMELFFDGWETRGNDVSKSIKTLFDWTGPTPKSLQVGKPNPPIVVFHWGQTASFEAYLKQVSAKYTMFSPQGVPIRASVNVSFEEVPSDPPPKTNPSSGGASGKRGRIVTGVDTLHSIAFAEYGDASLWRGLATVNGIDDPARIAAGTSLLIPPTDVAAELS